jgi:hypothetical protein
MGILNNTRGNERREQRRKYGVSWRRPMIGCEKERVEGGDSGKDDNQKTGGRVDRGTNG